jgi:hypothetical protein
MIPANAAPLAIALLGLVLGMRHATDPDHVIAVTTILSREHRLGAATRVGVVWGLGHTMTVLIVGAAIIVFKIAIPTRLGLAMEFAVAIVLILLGVNAAASLVRGATMASSSMRTRTLTTTRCIRIRTSTPIFTATITKLPKTRRITIIASTPTACRRSPRAVRSCDRSASDSCMDSRAAPQSHCWC